MKRVSIILPVNNKEMISQQDFAPYQTEQCHYDLSYADTDLKELNSVADGEAVIQPTIDKVIAAEQSGAEAAIVFCFGDIAIKEASQQVNIPVLGTGKYAIHVAAEICNKKYTILPGKAAHNDFIQIVIQETGLTNKFVLAKHGVDLFPSEIRNNPELTVERLYHIACQEIDENEVDTFTLGCTCFMGMAKPLQAKLQTHYQDQKKIMVIDPAEIALSIASALI